MKVNELSHPKSVSIATIKNGIPNTNDTIIRALISLFISFLIKLGGL